MTFRYNYLMIYLFDFDEFVIVRKVIFCSFPCCGMQKMFEQMEQEDALYI